MHKAGETLAEMTAHGKGTLVEYLGIELLRAEPGLVEGRMPVDRRHHQPMGILHGGVSVVLAETLGSLGANWLVDRERYFCVGQEVNANHLRSVSEGWVYACARVVHAGRRSQVWEIRIEDEQHKLVCISRLTMAVLERPDQG